MTNKMTNKMVKTDEEYTKALLRYYEIFNVKPDMEFIKKGLEDIHNGTCTDEVFTRFLNDLERRSK